VVGIVLLFLLLMGGRLVRRHMLLGPEGQWRQHLWLDELVQVETPAARAAPPEKPRLTSPLPVNTCSRDSLTLLPGVGPVLADRIDAARQSGLKFRSADDLQQVKGIGPALAAKLAPVVDFGRPDLARAAPDSFP
jgi:hypothetical protein